VTPLNVYLCGVGGQGIGLLSEVLGRACLAAGHSTRGCDTHGLAQRGGIVVSHLRLGDDVYTPLVPRGCADLVVSLERVEALRATKTMLRQGGTVVYYDAVYQPIHVRMGAAQCPRAEDVEEAVRARGGKLERVWIDDIADPRMQNVALLGRLAALGAIEGVGRGEIESALREVLQAGAVEANLALLERTAFKPRPRS
jgi:indolepyruvate ferredoxin oxidoreductase beta subunit